LANFNDATSKLLEEILEFFYNSFHLTIPHYLRNFSNLDRWLIFFTTILSAPADQLSIKSQEQVTKIYIKMFSAYCNDNLDGKDYRGWAGEFRQRYAAKLFGFIYELVSARKGNEESLTCLVNCLHEVVQR
jgi:hypothetical protein